MRENQVRKNGIIVSFEGIDGCGKSTQVKLFCEYLDNKGTEYIFLNEPGGTYTGEKIRKILLDSRNQIGSLSELFLYLASRSQLMEERIIPYAEKVGIIVIDRYIASTMANQGYGRGLSLKLIRYIHVLLLKPLCPI
jgi:dTMP kinase